jgi:hypothetical protein
MALRLALAAALLFQAAGTALDRGDMHRESVRWLVAHYTGAEKVLVSTNNVNEAALTRYGFGELTRVASINRIVVDRQLVLDRVRYAFQNEDRGFILIYYTRAPVAWAVSQLLDEGFFADSHWWKPTSAVIVIAVIRDEEDHDWLYGLPIPPHARGPANGNWP